MHHHGTSSNVSILQTSRLNALLHAIDTEWEKLDIALAEGDAEHAETLLTEIRRLTRQQTRSACAASCYVAREAETQPRSATRFSGIGHCRQTLLRFQHARDPTLNFPWVWSR